MISFVSVKRNENEFQSNNWISKYKSRGYRVVQAAPFNTLIPLVGSRFVNDAQCWSIHFPGMFTFYNNSTRRDIDWCADVHEDINNFNMTIPHYSPNIPFNVFLAKPDKRCLAFELRIARCYTCMQWT